MTLESFAKAGADTFNLMDRMIDFSRQTNQPLYFKHDTHWNTNATKVAAQGTAALLQQKYPDLVAELRTGAYRVVSTQVQERKSSSGWDGEIQAACPTHTLLGEPLPVLKLEGQQASTSESALFGEDNTLVVVAGTSFTQADALLGYDYYLSEALGNRVVTVSVGGGGPLGALFDYYAQPEVVDPRVLVWEVPEYLIVNPSTPNPLTVPNLRQVIPVLVAKSDSVWKRALSSVPQQFSVDVQDAKASGSNHYLQLTFDKYRTRELKLRLTYANGVEEVSVKRMRSSVLDRTFLELAPDKGTLRGVTVDLPSTPTGNVTVEVRRYR